MSDQGYAKRFVTGFAIVGLLLAGVIGVWTWQSTNPTTTSRSTQVTESEVAETSSTTPTSPTSTRPTRESAAPEAGSEQPVAPSETTTKDVAPLGSDPYLPPNTWAGAGSDPAQPTATLVADSLNPNGTLSPATPSQSSQAPGTTTAPPSQSQAPSPSQTQPSLPLPATPQGVGSSEPAPGADHPLLGIIPPRWRPQQEPTDTTSER